VVIAFLNEKKVGYIHRNPVKGGLVKELQDWRWSSVNEYYGVRKEPQTSEPEVCATRSVKKSALQSLDGYIMRDCWEPKWKFRINDLHDMAAGQRGHMQQNRNLRRWTIAATMACIALFTIVRARSAPGQSTTLIVTMDRMMTPAELRSTGVATLSASQRSALDNWLDAYTRRVLQAGMSHACRNWEDDTLRSVSDGGAILHADSGQVFEVDEVDRVDTELWLAADDILYHCAGRACTIINIDENGEVAQATLLK